MKENKDSLHTQQNPYTDSHIIIHYGITTYNTFIQYTQQVQKKCHEKKSCCFHFSRLFSIYKNRKKKFEKRTRYSIQSNNSNPFHCLAIKFFHFNKIWKMQKAMSEYGFYLFRNWRYLFQSKTSETWVKKFQVKNYFTMYLNRDK